MLKSPIYIVPIIGISILFWPSAIAASDRGAAIEHCRSSVGKPTVTTCMRAGGDHQSCHDQAVLAVKQCFVRDSGMIDKCKALAVQRGFDGRGYSEKRARAAFIRACIQGRQR